MSTPPDHDYYDIQFSTRQLALLFGLLVVIVGGVFVGGIVIGRNMSYDARTVIAERGVNEPLVPPGGPAETTPAAAPTGAPEQATQVTAVEAAPAPQPIPAPVEPRMETPSAAEATARMAEVPGGFATDQAQGEPQTARIAEPPPSPSPAAASAPTGRFTIQVAAFRDRAAAERLLSQINAMGLDGYLEGTPAGIFRVRVGRFATREDARAVATRLEAEELAALVTSRSEG